MATITTPVPKLVHMAAFMRLPGNVRVVSPVPAGTCASVTPIESLAVRYQRLVKETIPHIEAPPFARLKTLGNTADGVAAVETAKPRFVKWIDHAYNLVAASWAFRVVQDRQVRENFAQVRKAWERGGLGYTRPHVDVGLAQHIDPLCAALGMSDRNMRFEAMALGSSVLEEMTPALLSKETQYLATTVRKTAFALLRDKQTSSYRQAVSILALQRSLPAQPVDPFDLLRRDLLQLYVWHINADDTVTNKALLRSFAGLLSMFDVPIYPNERKLLVESMEVLLGVAHGAVSEDVRSIAERALGLFPKDDAADKPAEDLYAPQVLSEEFYI